MATIIAKPGDDVVDFFSDWLDTIEEPQNRERSTEILRWIVSTYPQLGFRFAWKQPMFTNEGTFIVSFSPATKHLSLAPEAKGVEVFAERLDAAGISHGTKFIRLPWNKPVPYDLICDIVDFNIADKQGVTSFWR